MAGCTNPLAKKGCRAAVKVRARNCVAAISLMLTTGVAQTVSVRVNGEPPIVLFNFAGHFFAMFIDSMKSWLSVLEGVPVGAVMQFRFMLAAFIANLLLLDTA